jgi:hypothetical protein
MTRFYFGKDFARAVSVICFAHAERHRGVSKRVVKFVRQSPKLNGLPRPPILVANAQLLQFLSNSSSKMVQCSISGITYSTATAERLK